MTRLTPEPVGQTSPASQYVTQGQQGGRLHLRGPCYCYCQYVYYLSIDSCSHFLFFWGGGGGGGGGGEGRGGRLQVQDPKIFHVLTRSPGIVPKAGHQDSLVVTRLGLSLHHWSEGMGGEGGS